MIQNIPTADELRLVSLRLFFKAWGDTAGIITEWAEYGLTNIEEGSEGGATTEWLEYIAKAQSDLQAIYTLIQQSQEIGLKARICEVSPFLLLKRTDIKPADEKNGVWDFTDFPTLEASELVRVHNTFCSTTLSKEFQAKYEEIRKGRNKISHLGIYKQRIEPEIIIDILQMQYTELYPGRRWMEDRLHFAALGRWADYGDSDYNERTGLYYELWHLIPELSDGQFKWLMGHDPAEARFVCHSCAHDAGLGNNEPYGSDVPTAYPIDESHVQCVICAGVQAIRKSAKCPVPDCGCELQSDEADYRGQCMACENEPNEWAESRKRQAEQLRRFKSPD